MTDFRCLASHTSTAATSGPRTNGVEFYVTATAWLKTIWAWRPTTSIAMPTSAALYLVSSGAQLVLAASTTAASTATGWIPFQITTPYKLTANTRYRAGALFPGTTSTSVPGVTNYWGNGGAGTNGLTSGPLVMPGQANATNNRQGNYNSGSTRTFPNTSSTSYANYGIDVTVSDTDPAGAVQPTWAPNPATTGTLTWQADTTQTTAPLAGYASSSSQRQRDDASGFNDNTIPWPPTYGPAPFGRPGRAMMIRVPDAYRRYEVNPHPSNTFPDGSEAWFGFSFCLGADMDTTINNYQVIWQIHGSPGGGSPTVALEAVNDKLRITGGANRPNPTTLAYDTGSTYAYQIDLLPVIKHRWYHFVAYIGFWSEVNSGRLDAWVDGIRYVTNYVPPCGTNYPKVSQTDSGDDGRAYAKSGIYHRETSFRGATIWIAQQTLGTGYGAVDPTRQVAEIEGMSMAAA